ncbi:MAG: DHHA1 domain-containing protein, partial [Acidobacteriota bacterium]
ELCGGCHVRNTGEIGPFVITSEKSIASGVRRIEARTGEGALQWFREHQRLLDAVEAAVGAPAERAAAEVAALKDKLRQTERELGSLRVKLVSGEAAGGGGEVVVDGVKVLAREVPAAPASELRNMADVLRSKLGSGVVVLGTRADGKVSLIAAVTPDLVGKVKAGEVVKRVAPVVGGSGGGRPDFAQAGGKDPDRLPDALAAVTGVVRDLLAG